MGLRLLAEQECYRTAQEVLDIVADTNGALIPLTQLFRIGNTGGFWLECLEFSRNMQKDIEEVTDAFTKQNVHFMVSVWPISAENEKNEAYQGI